MNELFASLSNCCLSGGALGADLQWGMCAGKMGHNVIHWSFFGHRSLAPLVELVCLSDEQLSEANDAIAVAAKHLSMNTPKNLFVRRLIQRNYFQIAWSDSLYAVATIKNHKVEGGTGWAVQMMIDRQEGKPIYVFDQNTLQWMQYHYGNGKFLQALDVPTPEGIWAGIGSRALKKDGKEAIRKITNYY